MHPHPHPHLTHLSPGPVLALAAVLLTVAGCARIPQGVPAVIAPNAHLVVQGVPPIPASMAASAARYTHRHGAGFVAWHPARQEMLVSLRKPGSHTPQLFRVAAPMATPEQVTDFSEPVREATYEPFDGRYIVFARGSGGDEADQLHRLDLADRKLTQLTDPDWKHAIGAWLHRQPLLLTMALPLDRAAPGGRRSEVTQRLTLMDPMHPERARRLADLPGGGWAIGGVSGDDRTVALTRHLSATESQIWLLDLESARTTQLLPGPGHPSAKAVHSAGPFTPDGRGLMLTSDRAGEFRATMLYRFDRRQAEPISRPVSWDHGHPTLASDGKTAAFTTNVDGRETLQLVDLAKQQDLPAPVLEKGSITRLQFHPRSPELAFTVADSRSPNQVFSLNTATGAIAQWTRVSLPADGDGADTGLRSERIVHWPSFDGRSISGILHMPPTRFAGKRPVLVLIHGGPESQAKIAYLDRDNHLIDELGIAVIRPNVRGSDGYGKTFLALDDGLLREGAVHDIGALLDWIATQPELDASRVVVSGRSYGGFMSLAVAARYADRLAGAIDTVGISDFLTFLDRTESYRRDLRRVEYGDERIPQMREFLRRISPMTQAGSIRKPLLVFHGKNDPRVPYTEAEQIVAKVRENGTRVWYVRADNEGHSFVHLENLDFQFFATLAFLRDTMQLP